MQSKLYQRKISLTEELTKFILSFIYYRNQELEPITERVKKYKSIKTQKTFEGYTNYYK